MKKEQVVVTVESTFSNPQILVEALVEAKFGGSVIKDTGGDKSSTPSDGKPKPGLSDENKSAGNDRHRPSSFSKRLTVSSHLDRNVLRPGDRFRLAVVIDVEKGWHIYGNPHGPGVGRPTVISATSAKGFQFEPARYAPAHKAEQDFGAAGKTWIWELTGKTVHYLTGTVDDNLKPGKYEWSMQIDGQACTETACLPGTTTSQFAVEVVAKTSSTVESHTELFAGYDAAKLAPDDSGE